MWLFKGKEITTPPKDYTGFIYKITLPDKSFYIGKKAFTHKKKTKLSKKAKLLPENKGKRVSITQKDSGWLSYYGSSIPLKNHLKTLSKKDFANVKREILCFCKTKQDLSYREMENLVLENVLFKDNCWNGNILSRFFKGKINEI